MDRWILETIEQFGNWGVFFLIAIENLFPPIPSEVILTFAGFMTTSTSLSLTSVIISATLGSMVGAVILYYLGKLFGQERLERWTDRWGRYLRLTKGDLHRAQGWFEQHGGLTVFFCRFIPLIRSLISIPAGLAGMGLIPFLLYSLAGTLIWNTALVYFGAAVGSSWDTLAGYFDLYGNIVYAGIAVVVVVVAFRISKRRARK